MADPFCFVLGTSSGEYSAKLTAEGTYTITVSAIGPDEELKALGTKWREENE